MKKEDLCIESFIPEFEEFVSNEEKHEFSKSYKDKKKNMLKGYRKSMLVSRRKQYARVAVFVGVLVLASPFAVNAATNGALFDRIWGNAGKEDIASHDEILYDAEKGKEITVTYPARDYVEVDEEQAKELIGDNMSYEPIVEQIGDTTLTILSTVYDGNSAVVEFTLEREGGVNALNYSQLDNEAKGAWFSDESTFWFHFMDCGEHIYVDLEKSTNEKLYCYDYLVAFDGISMLNLEILEYPNGKGNYAIDKDEDIKTRQVLVPLGEKVTSTQFVNADGGTVIISPMSMTIDMKTGLGLEGDEAGDPGNIYYVNIQYKDGSSYLVMDDVDYSYTEDGTEILLNNPDVIVDNTSYACGTLGHELILEFNRLVSIGMIDTITVNEVAYKLSE